MQHVCARLLFSCSVKCSDWSDVSVWYIYVYISTLSPKYWQDGHITLRVLYGLDQCSQLAVNRVPFLQSVVFIYHKYDLKTHVVMCCRLIITDQLKVIKIQVRFEVCKCFCAKYIYVHVTVYHALNRIFHIILNIILYLYIIDLANI